MSNVAVKQNDQEDWQFLPIKEFAHTTSGGTPKRGVAEYYNGDVPWVKSGDLNDGHLNQVDEYITELGLEKSSAKLFKPGTLLIALYGATIGRLSILNFEASTNQAICGISVPEDVDVKYLFYYLLRIRQKLIDQGKGGAQPNINQQIVKETVVPIAPPKQQKRIVAKIEELFSHIDAGIEALKKTKQLLKQYRKSVLKAAVTGELTKEWREANKSKLEPASDVHGSTNAAIAGREGAAQLLERILKERRQKWEKQQLEQFKTKGKMPKDDKWKEKYKEPLIPDATDLPEIPEEWLWVTMGVLCDKITDGTHHSPPNGPNGDFKYITAKNIKPWKVDLTKITYISKKVHDEIYSRCDVRKGDVLYIKDGATTGIAALNKLDEEFSLLSSVGVLRFPSECFREYFVSALNSPLIMDMLLSKVAGVAITRLTLRKLNEGFITLPPVEEQKEIVRVVDEKLSSIEHLALELEQQLIKGEKNKQSILASAFSGTLN